jgi:formate dehydrogenase iron-sulfur subunit
MAEIAIYYDASKCTACKGCQVNCKQWNQLPAPLEESPWTGSYESPAANSGDTWLRIMFHETESADGKIGWAFGRDACQHCKDAGCVKACPSGACHYTDSGTVAIDKDKCIGCQFCVAACPFDVPKYRSRDKVSQKCWMCQDRTENGLGPACVHTCPTGALLFGDRDEMLAKAKERVAEIKPNRPDAVVYGEKEMGGLHVIQVLPFGAEAHGMPVNPKAKITNTTEQLLRPLTGLGVLAVLGVSLASFVGGRGFPTSHATPEEAAVGAKEGGDE